MTKPISWANLPNEEFKVFMRGCVLDQTRMVLIVDSLYLILASMHWRFAFWLTRQQFARGVSLVDLWRSGSKTGIHALS